MKIVKKDHDCDLSPSTLRAARQTTFEKVFLGRLYSNIFSLSIRVAKYSNIYRSTASMVQERKRHLNSRYWFVVHPLSEFRFVWDTIMVLVFLVSFIMTPYEILTMIFFMEVDPESYVNLGGIMMILHGFCGLNIIMNLVTGHYKKYSNRVIFDPKLILLHYVKGFFITDVLSTIPAMYVSYVLYIEKGWEECEDLLKILCLLNFLRLLRFITVGEYVSRMVVHFKCVATIAVLRFLTTLLIFFHWCTCVVFIVPFLISPGYAKDFRIWFEDWKDEEKYDLMYFYMLNLYHSVTVSFADEFGMDQEKNVGDFVKNILCFTFGQLYSAYIFIESIELLRLKLESKSKYDEFMLQLKEYMKHKQLPQPVQKRLVSFFEYRYGSSYFREDTIMKILSDALKSEIKLHGCEMLLRRVDIFRDLPHDVSSKIADFLRPQVYLPKDLIIKVGSVGNSMYFISSGTVAVYTLSGREVCHLYDGDYFGEVALLMKDRKRIASVIAIEICELYILDRNTFLKYLAINEEIRAKLLDLAMKRLKETKALETATKKSLDRPSKKDLIDSEY